LLKAATGCLGAAWDSEQCLRTIAQQVTPRLPATMSQP